MQFAERGGPALAPAKVPGKYPEDQCRHHQCPSQQRQVGHKEPTLVADRLIRTVVHPLTQVFAWFEVRDVFSGKRDCFSGFRISALPWGSEMQGEAAEAANLDPL